MELILHRNFAQENILIHFSHPAVQNYPEATWYYDTWICNFPCNNIYKVKQESSCIHIDLIGKDEIQEYDLIIN